MNAQESQSLSYFRAMVSNIFRLTMAVADGQNALASDLFDNILHQLEKETRANAKMASAMQDTLTNAFLARDLMREVINEPPSLRIHSDAPSSDVDDTDVALLTKADVKVTKAEPTPNTDHIVHVDIKNTILPTPVTMPIAKVEKVAVPPTPVRATKVDVEEETEGEVEEAEEEVVEEEEEAEEEVVEEEEEAEEEVVEEEEEVEAEAEEEEGMEIIKIGKKKYFCGEHSKQVYVYVNDEEAGDCLGRYENGKIVPL